MQKEFSNYGVEKLSLSKWVSHNIGVFVYDQHKIIIQIIDGNGKLLLKSLFYNANVLQNLYCTGFEYNAQRNYLYIGCFGMSGGQTPGKLFIFTYDLHLEDVVSTVSLDQQDGWNIKNQLELRIFNAPQDSNEETYLIAYDQGHGHARESRDNHNFRVFRNVMSRQLTYYYLGGIEAHDHDHSILYDLWSYQGSIIATGRTEETHSIITLAQCKLDNASRKLFCGHLIPTLVTEGYVAIQNESVLVTVDIPTRLITAYQLEGDYGSKGFETQIDQVINADLIDTQDHWINGLTYSSYGGAINWTQTGFAVEFATTIFNWRLNYSDTLVGMFGFAWNKSLILGDSKTGYVQLQRNVLGELIVNPHQLNFGDNALKVTAKDKDNEVSENATITLMKNINEKVEWNGIVDFQVLDNHKGVKMPIDGTSINSGNLLNISAVSANPSVLSIDDAFYAKKINITWDAISKPSGNFLFNGQASVIDQDIQGGSRSLIFSLCTQPWAGQDVSCKVIQQIKLKKSELLGEKILFLSKNLIVAYSTDPSANTTTIYAANETTLYKQVHNEVFNDIAGYAGVTASMDYVAFSNSDHVGIHSVNPNDITEWNGVIHLNAEHFDELDFCPTEVRSQQITHDKTKMGWFIILSNCHSGKNYSQEVFTWAVTASTPEPRLPLSTLDNPKKICAFLPEIIVMASDRIYGVSLWDDYNYWSVPLDQLNVDIDQVHLHCDESLGHAVIVGHTEGSTEKTLVHLRGNSGMRQDRRYPHSKSGLEVDWIHTGNLFGGLLHVGYDTEFGFYQSFLEPVVIMSSKTVTGDTDVNVTVTITNGTISKDTVSKVTVVHQTEKVNKMIAGQ